jgi:hypothetical protein
VINSLINEDIDMYDKLCDLTLKNMNLLTAKAGSTGDLSWMAFKEELYFISINNGEHSDLVV